MIKFIATDMDGTLLDSNHKLPNDFGEILEELKERDILFSISTGRNYLDILNKVKDYKDDIMFICENGSVIYYKDECIFSNFLNKDSIKQIVKIGRKINDAYVVLCGTKALYLEDKEGIDLINKNFPTQAPIIKVDSLLDVEDSIFKVNMFDMSNAELNSYRYFKKHDIENIKVIPSGKYWLDIIDVNINKGVAIKKIQEKFDIDYKETIVFGDHLNDLEMMDSAYHSYAMKNTHPKVKEVANFETEYTNDENGVIKTIKENIIEKAQPAI
ncbi:MAG: HAD family hydrolase [Paraclostridium sp.]